MCCGGVFTSVCISVHVCKCLCVYTQHCWCVNRYMNVHVVFSSVLGKFFCVVHESGCVRVSVVFCIELVCVLC